MKRTNATFLLALAVYFGLIVFSRAQVPPRIEEPLDFEGIDTLEINSLRDVSVNLRPTPGGLLSYPGREKGKVSVHRQGNVLRVEVQAETYVHVQVRVPPGVDRFIVDGAMFETEAPRGDVEISASASVDWSGPVRSLRIIDTRRVTTDCQPGCRSNLSVQKGKVGKLHVTTATGLVLLGEPGDLGEAVLELGPEAGLTVQDTRGFDNLRILPLDAPAAIAPADPEPDSP